MWHSISSMRASLPMREKRHFSRCSGMRCASMWLWQGMYASFPRCFSSSASGGTGRRWSMFGAPISALSPSLLRLLRWQTSRFTAIGASLSTPLRCSISARHRAMQWQVSILSTSFWDLPPSSPLHYLYII